jgi:hypothetical protein
MMTVLQIRRIKTGHPERETWRHLSLFSREARITKLVTTETAKNQVISCILQAKEFYSLSKSASILTKPILLYYAMQRLAKALIFLKNPTADPIALRHHGLSGKGIYDESEKFLQNRISNTKTGIFFEFSQNTTDNNILRKKTVYEKGGYFC